MAKKATTVTKADIDLCLKALGLPYDAKPAQIEQAYEAFMAKCKRNLLSADPVKRENTRNDMDIIAGIYFNIKKSVTYADRLKHAPSQSRSSDSSSMTTYSLIAICVMALAVGGWFMLK